MSIKRAAAGIVLAAGLAAAAIACAAPSPYEEWPAAGRCEQTESGEQYLEVEVARISEADREVWTAVGTDEARRLFRICVESLWAGAG